MILNLKGIKKDFSGVPIDYEKIRKEDIHQPKDRFFKPFPSRKFMIHDSQITELKQKNDSNTLLIFIHGGAFISGPSKTHWDAAKSMVKRTNHNLWMCDYPKAPENTVTKIANNIDAVYQKALIDYTAKNIFLIGDSAGGTLILNLVQDLIKNEIDLPKKIILISPVMDASLTNPTIELTDKKDPILSKKGLLKRKFSEPILYFSS